MKKGPTVLRARQALHSAPFLLGQEGQAPIVYQEPLSPSSGRAAFCCRYSCFGLHLVDNTLAQV